MKMIFAVAAVLFSTTGHTLSMKLEGSCTGKLANGTMIAFEYYSNFDGCSNNAKAALSYDQGREGALTGSRSFTDKDDNYNFGNTRLIFANSTGNTTGKYRYTDSRGITRTVTLQCNVRDYEYGECQ